jgi:ATP-dependent DNA helicase RecG
MSRLPINLNDLLYQRTVEGERIEYKEGWNPDPIIRTLCAFANDFENLGGGYLIIGLQEEEGKPALPPVGVPDNQLNKNPARTFAVLQTNSAGVLTHFGH